MSTNLENENKTATILNGVVLTGEAIKSLADAQQHSNEYLNFCISTIADFVCGFAVDPDIIKCFGNIDEREAVANLSSVRDFLKTLRKP